MIKAFEKENIKIYEDFSKVQELIYLNKIQHHNKMSAIYKEMQNFLEDQVWDQLIEFSTLFPMNWAELEKCYELKKLQLEKLYPEEILLLKNEFHRKYETTSQNIYQKNDKVIEKIASQFWMENEYRIFIWFILTYSKIINLPPEFYVTISLIMEGIVEWNLVSQSFQKSILHCQYFYLSCKKMKINKWTKEEDHFINTIMKECVSLYRDNKSGRWTEIGVKLFEHSQGQFFRKPKSIRERWLSHLNPVIKKECFTLIRVEWSDEEDEQLLELVQLFGKKWSKISNSLGNRSEHSVKNRFNQLESRYPKPKGKNIKSVEKLIDEVGEENEKVALKSNEKNIASETSLENALVVKTEGYEDNYVFNFLIL